MSLKIIHINELGDSLTVDSTLISVDSTLITVDQTNYLGLGNTLRLPYRFFTPIVKLVLWSEMREIETILELDVIDSDGLMVLFFNHDFQDGESFEAKVTDLDDKLIWRGKLLATLQTDLENYILHKEDNGIIKI